MIDNFDKFFLFLGDTDKEGVTSKLKTSDFEYVKKILNSGEQNWRKIIALMRKDDIAGVMLSLPAHSMRLLVSDSRIDLTREILEILRGLPHLIFVHETFFRGRISIGEEGEYYDFGVISDEERASINNLLDEFSLKLIPYKTNAEMSVLASEFVDAYGSNLAFRMYIPHDRLWSKESGAMIGLFRDYLTKVSGIGVRQEQNSTPLGTVYEFFASETANPSDLETEFRDFSRLLDTVVSDPEAARNELLNKNIKYAEVSDILDRYTKEAKRLHVDLKHERERKILSIRHRLEAELVDIVTDQSDWKSINQMVDAAIPQLAGISTSVGLLASPTHRSDNVTINLNPQIIQTANGIVAQEIHGNQSFGVDVSEVLQIIQQYGNPQEALQLSSAVYEVEDPSIRPEKKLTALQKIKGFVYQAGEKLPDIAAGVLQAYIESKLGL